MLDENIGLLPLVALGVHGGGCKKRVPLVWLQQLKQEEVRDGRPVSQHRENMWRETWSMVSLQTPMSSLKSKMRMRGWITVRTSTKKPLKSQPTGSFQRTSSDFMHISDCASLKITCKR